MTRNSARGADQWNVTLRVNRSFNLGGVLSGGPIMMGGPGGRRARAVGGGRVVPERAAPLSAQRGPGGGAGDGGGPVVREMIMDGSTPSRYRLDLYAQAFNLLNTTNLNGFVGNLQSPYFGTATSAAAARRIEIGASISF